MSPIRQFEIVSNGLPKAGIIVKERAGSTELFAAEELQKYVRAISGATLPIGKNREVSEKYSIFIGESEEAGKPGISTDNKETDGFIIKTTNNDLFLQGNNSRGTLYAVYHLLEILGCRWYEAGKSGEVVPKMKDITLKEIDITEEPDFDIRSFWPVYFYKDDKLSVMDWMAKNKMNWIYYTNDFGKYDDFIVPILDEIKKRGIQIELGQHTLTPDTFGLDPELLETKPECFALVNGKRGEGVPLRICYTNKEAIRLTANKVIAFCKKRPEIKRCSILFRDAITGWCECENCRAVQAYKIDPLRNVPKASDLNAYFIDKLTSEIKDELPDMQFSFFAVYNNREVPENPNLLPKNPNVYVTLDHFERCHTHFLTEGECERNLVIREDNLKWKKAYPGKMWIWNMAPGTFDYNIGMVSPLTDIINDSISFGKQLEVSGMITNWEDSQSLPSNQYLYARLLWDTELDISKMKEVFFKKYYGPSSEIIRRYAKEFGEYPHNFKTHTGHRDQRALLAHLTDQKIIKLKRLLESARQSVSEKEYEDRVSMAIERFELMELWKKLENTLDEAREIAGKKNIQKIQQLEKQAQELFFLISEHKDPANKRLVHRPRRKELALLKYNQLRMLSAEENRLHNGGFEEGVKYFIPFWKFRCGELGVIDTEVFHSGKKSFCFWNPAFRLQYEISQTVTLKQEKPRAIHFGGWYKTEEVKGKRDSGFSFRLQILTNNNELIEEQILLEQGTHPWKKAEKITHLNVPIFKATFRIVFLKHRSKAWFDDIFLEEVN